MTVNLCASWYKCSYFTLLATDVKVSLSGVPMDFTAAMIASAMLPAMMAYSMAVAPFSDCQKRRNVRIEGPF